MQFQYQSASVCHVGKVREVNEDRVLEHNGAQLWVVADGMGGYEFGDIASQMIVEALEKCEQSSSLSLRIKHVKQALYRVNHYLSQEKTLSQSQVVGSTVCCFVMVGGECACIWSGDSRGYLYRYNQLHQLSDDHSTECNGREALTQAIGMGDTLDIEHKIFSLQANDQLLLISDGVYKHLSDEALISTLHRYTPEQSVKLIEYGVLNDGAIDNFSGVVISVEA